MRESRSAYSISRLAYQTFGSRREFVKLTLIAFFWFGCLYAWGHYRVRAMVDREKWSRLDEEKKLLYRNWPPKSLLRKEGLSAYYIRNASLAIVLLLFVSLLF